jgi:toxin ParE1/3/4
MSQVNYKISHQATKDLENIWQYTFENWSIEQADKYINFILNELEHLADYPESGKDFHSIRQNYRYSKIKSHIIFYRISEFDGPIEIIRVLHERMDLENRLDD